MTKGVDVSGNQGKIDWEQVASAGIAFAYCKATEGLGWSDDTFEANWSGAGAAGIVRGAYHLFSWRSDPRQQAMDFMAKLTCGWASGDLPPALDIEAYNWSAAENTSASAASGLLTWLQVVEASLGVRPVMYVRSRFWSDVLRAPVGFLGYRVWIAHYTDSASPDMPANLADWTFWQHSRTGRIAGIQTSVDLDQFNGDIAALQFLKRP